jgi:MFS family permease
VLLLGLGLGYSVFAAVIWPSVAYVVDSKALGTAYGVVTSLQNFGLFAIPLLVGAVHEATRRWQPSNPWSCVELVFAAQAALGVAAALGLNADPLVRLALNSPTGRLPDGHRIFVQDGWLRSPDASRHPSPIARPLSPAGRVSHSVRT